MCLFTGVSKVVFENLLQYVSFEKLLIVEESLKKAGCKADFLN